MLGPLLPGLQARWGIGDARAGMLFAAQFLASVAASAGVGPLAKRFPYFRLIAAGLLLMAVGAAGLTSLPWPFPLLAVALYGCGLGLAIPAGNLQMAALHPGNSARSVMILNLTWCVGAVLAPLVVTHAPLWTVSAACAGLAGLMGGGPRSSGEPVRDRPGGLSYRWAITALILFLYVGTENAVAGWVASLGARAASTRQLWSVLPAAFWAGILAGRAAAPGLLARMKPPGLVLAGLGGAFAGAALLLAQAGAAWTLAGTALCGLGLAPVFPLVVSQYADAEPAGAASGLIFSAAGLGGAAIPWMVGALSQATGSLRGAMGVVPGLVVAMAVLQLNWRQMKKTILLLAIACAALGAGRQTTPLEDGWKFFRGDDAAAAQAAFDDSAWQTVRVPHTFDDGQDPPQSGYYRGPGWYRRHFAAPADWKSRRVFVRFEAASLVADVYLNGKRLGEHKGGFQAFCFEVTGGLRDGDNVLAVRVDNARREDVIPLAGDFTVFGGLYRPVSLIATAPVDITLLDAGSWGVFIRQHGAGSRNADVEVTSEVSNGSAAARKVEIATTVFNARHTRVAGNRQTVDVGAGETRAVRAQLALANPHLWNGVADPYLYTVTVEVRENGAPADAVDQPLGVREFHVDAARGAVLNGKAQQIRGVCRHQDWAGTGWAIDQAQQDTDMRLIREIGATGVRLAHYQHNPYFYGLCDRNGLLVWAEIPMVNDVRGTPEFLENARRQLTELIRQNMNHPSIVMWSLYNEISPNNKDNPAPIVENLKALAKKEDPARPTTGALSIDGIEKLPAVGRLNDILALNVYPGWYVDTARDMGRIIDKWNEFYGSKGIIISEYGAGASIHQHQQDFTGRTGRAPNNWHPEEYQSLVHEENYPDIAARPFVYGSFVWSMFDFASAGRKEGDTPGINDKGLVTRDRKVKKDAFFFYKANWNPEPMVYLTSRRDTPRTDAVTPVKVYSNLPKVALKVNGKSYGEKTGSKFHVFEWSGVQLQEGENRIEAQSGAVQDECVWELRKK
jgi:beta-galactosidase